MGLLMAFVVGYVVGGRGGGEGFDEVVASLQAVRDSQEVEDLLVALRSHAGHVLKELGSRLEGGASAPVSISSILERAKSFVQNDAKETAF
jgi:hypothetical protein